MAMAAGALLPKIMSVIQLIVSVNGVVAVGRKYRWRQKSSAVIISFIKNVGILLVDKYTLNIISQLTCIYYFIHYSSHIIAKDDFLIIIRYIYGIYMVYIWYIYRVYIPCIYSNN